MLRTMPLRLMAAISSVAAMGIIWTTAVSAQAASDSQLLYRLMSRMEQLEQEIRQLRGDLELYQYRQKELARRLKGLESETNILGPTTRGDRLGESPVDQGGPAGSESEEVISRAGELTGPGQRADMPPVGEASPFSEGASSVLVSPEREAYDTAFNSLREGDYEEAIGRLQTFVATYPDSRLAPNAQYWLGEAYYVTRDFTNAKEMFLNLGTQHPDSDKLPDAMLKLGYVYELLGDKAKAREVLQRLVQAYPNSRPASLAEARLKSID